MGRKDSKFHQVIDEKALLEIESKLPKQPGHDGYDSKLKKFHEKTYKDLFPDRKENRYLKEKVNVEEDELEQIHLDDVNDPGAYRKKYSY